MSEELKALIVKNLGGSPGTPMALKMIEDYNKFYDYLSVPERFARNAANMCAALLEMFKLEIKWTAPYVFTVRINSDINVHGISVQFLPTLYEKGNRLYGNYCVTQLIYCGGSTSCKPLGYCHDESEIVHLAWHDFQHHLYHVLEFTQ